jgi:hypothetical protein
VLPPVPHIAVVRRSAYAAAGSMQSHLGKLVNSLALAVLFTGLAMAQDDDAGSKVLVVGKKPDAATQAQKLDHVKLHLLPRVWPAKCTTDEQFRRKYVEKWQLVVSEHYAVFTNGPKQTCQKYAVTLEELYDAIQKELPFKDPDHLLVAYIFADKEDYYRYCENITGYSKEAARNTAGHATSDFYATYYSSPRDEVVFHEAAHEIVGACLKVPGVGSWFQEGLAVYFENKMTNGALDASARAQIKTGAYYPLEQFFAIDSLLGDPAGHGFRNYEHAGALMNFLLNTKLAPVAGNFGKLLAEARKGRGFAYGPEASAKLVRAAYGLSVKELEQLWLQHLKVD